MPFPICLCIDWAFTYFIFPSKKRLSVYLNLKLKTQQKNEKPIIGPSPNYDYPTIIYSYTQTGATAPLNQVTKWFYQTILWANC
jgi:hypothetical protein